MNFPDISSPFSPKAVLFAAYPDFSAILAAKTKGMLQTDLQYENTYRVRAYEIDSLRRMTIPALSRLMQEAALQNVIEVGMSFWDLEPYHLSWVLNRQQIFINRLPGMNEPIRVLTYPAGFLRMFTLRDYKVFAEDGALLVYSPSIWLLMDTRSRSLAPHPPFIQGFGKRMPPREQCLKRPTGKLPTLDTVGFQTAYKVQWHDLDFNMHLNNTLYIQWMLDPLPPKVLSERALRFLDINYRAECQLHDPLRAEVQAMGDGEYLHRIIRTSDNKVLANARTIWEE